MAVQDLTPQLRTRLGRLERWVGVFVTLATLLTLIGLAYYVYNTAQRKGWFLTKAPYFIYLHSGGGVKAGDTVMLMGFPAGEVTHVTAAPPFTYDANGRMLDVYVEFIIRTPYIGYVWSDSVVKVKSSGLLGSRYLEVTKGGTSGSTNKLFETYKENTLAHKLEQMLLTPTGSYTNYRAGLKYLLPVEEPPDLGAQMDEMARTIKNAVPSFLSLTNQLNGVFSNANSITRNLDTLLLGAQPIVANMATASTNLAAITGTLHDTKGALGDWLLPTNIQNQLVLLLPNVNRAVTNVNTNLVAVVDNVNTNLVSLVGNLNKSLENIAGITSNLNVQVQANSNILAGVSKMVVDADDMVQGLKHHWLLRSAFKPATTTTTNQPIRPPALSPKGADQLRPR